MAGAGLLKGELFDAPRVANEKKLAAQRSRFSPWTGYQTPKIASNDSLGTALKYGAAGVGLAGQMKSADLLQAKIDEPTHYSGIQLALQAPSLGANTTFDKPMTWAEMMGS